MKQTLQRIAAGFLLGLPLAASDGQDGTQPPIPPIARKLPPPGSVSLPHDLRAELETRLREWRDPLWEIGTEPYSADVEVLVKAVDLALIHGEFYAEKDVKLPAEFLDLARARYREIEDGGPPSWTKDRGRIIRGYRSSIDESCQPYGLEISPELALDRPVPLLVWLHGRGDQVTDLHFLDRCRRLHQAFGGQLGEQDRAIVLHPFGRHSVGWKHAGEIDVLEAIEAVRRDYPIDPDRIILAGFSMGGAGAWHIGAHYRELFCAVHAGAGFVDTARYNRLTPEIYPPVHEQILWQLYDVPLYRRNFLNGPLLVYSGENDKQRAAADIMVEALAPEGLAVRHIIGEGTGHKYHPDAVAQIWEWMKACWDRGRDPAASTVHLQTRTLRYPSQHWIRVTGLEKHWDDTRVEGSWNRDQARIRLRTKNTTSLRIASPDGADIGEFTIEIDGQELGSKSPGFPVGAFALRRAATGWEWGEWEELRKRPGIQGPIDDAFLGRFVVVPPDVEILHPKLRRWVNFELEHFRSRWTALMRGRLLEYPAHQLDSRDIDDANLILWGDPVSNPMIAEIVERLPIEWGVNRFTFRGTTYDAKDYVPVFVFPNPLNPKRSVVINSGLTFREGHDRTNSLQNPKLPDWAVIGLDTMPDALAPGRIVEAGFFDENWR